HASHESVSELLVPQEVAFLKATARVVGLEVVGALAVEGFLPRLLVLHGGRDAGHARRRAGGARAPAGGAWRGRSTPRLDALCRPSSRRGGGSRRGDTSCNSCRPRPLLSGAWAYTFPGSLLSVASAFARAFVSRDGAVPVDSFAGAAGSLHLHIGLHFGLRHLGFVVAREAVVRLEADGRTDLELDGGEHLLHLTREVRVLQIGRAHV